MAHDAKATRGIFNRIDDRRGEARAAGRIAGMLQARGQPDEALALHEERVPIAERMRDIESTAHIRYSTALLRLQLWQHRSGGLQRIHDDLADALAIRRQLATGTASAASAASANCWRRFCGSPASATTRCRCWISPKQRS